MATITCIMELFEDLFKLCDHTVEINNITINGITKNVFRCIYQAPIEQGHKYLLTHSCDPGVTDKRIKSI